VPKYEKGCEKGQKCEPMKKVIAEKAKSVKI